MVKCSFSRDPALHVKLTFRNISMLSIYNGGAIRYIKFIYNEQSNCIVALVANSVNFISIKLSKKNVCRPLLHHQWYFHEK